MALAGTESEGVTAVAAVAAIAGSGVSGSVGVRQPRHRRPTAGPGGAGAARCAGAADGVNRTVGNDGAGLLPGNPSTSLLEAFGIGRAMAYRYLSRSVDERHCSLELVPENAVVDGAR